MKTRLPALALIAASGPALAQAPAPVAVDDSYTFASRATFSAAAAGGVLANDSGPRPLAAVLINGPAHGTLKLSPDGSFAYAPLGDGYHGPDTFTYGAEGGGARSNTGTVRLQVVAPPIAADDRYDVRGGLAVGPAKGVLANDLEPNGPFRANGPTLPMLASVVAPPAHGRLILYPDGALSYIANPGYVGPDRFTYKATNGIAEATATVNLDVAKP